METEVIHSESNSNATSESPVAAVPPVDGANGSRNLTTADVTNLRLALEKLKEKGTDPNDPNYQLLSQLVNQAAPAAASAAKPALLTPEQVGQLRVQMLAYKYLAKNQPMPPALFAAIKNFSRQQQQQARSPAMQAAQQTAQQQMTQHLKDQAVQAVQPGAAAGTAKPGQPAATAAAKPTQALPVGPPKPDNIPIAYPLQARERRIAARITAPADELP
eukprot:TRINITY_DN27071_c0_g1_i1.p1 TRINITY_DN27071_c0_g1~~TRINITY_DN27071_c0_g1_i1.p1  ORF type:complete len:218 (+),score=70.72 TRINITY_DN27071_c0_g1_i1:119-772(+)